ncbi:MAG: pyrroloquinoline quinone-dependent dehydrogenase [Gammaproteobacteria bacterium]|nr:pyrroloquinoline quinone-dependent dehydrogenase [Gammaproteobacteria bacterium]
MRFPTKTTVFCAAMLAAVLTSADSFGADPESNRGWGTYGAVPGGGRYSALDQVNRNTVDALEVAWVHRSGHSDRFKNGMRPASYEVTPIFANNHLYICTPVNRILAINPETGAENWAFDPHKKLITEDPNPFHCRGVSYWQAENRLPGTACQKRIFNGDRDGRLFAVDADTGRPCEDFGDGGFVDLKDSRYGGTGDIFLTSPVAILGDAVIIAGAVGDNIRADSADGVIRALDARTGELLWRLVTIPEHLRDTTGGADVWPPYTVDTERNMVFMPTGSPSVDVYGVQRGDPIPYANALLAIDGATGEVIWHYQIVHHDLFDYDLPAQPLLVDLDQGGETVPAVIQITKMGTVFAFHRETGEPLFPIEERSVPASDVPGEMAALTQPFPVKPEPFSHQVVREEEIFGLTFWDRNKCRESLSSLRYDGIFTPPSERGSLMLPSPAGGGNWGGVAFEPQRNVLIVKANNIGMVIRLIPGDGDEQAQAEYQEGGSVVSYMEETPYSLEIGMWNSPFGVPCNSPPWGEISAIDMDTGEYLWRQPLGQVSFGPFNLFKTFKSWGSPTVGGPIVTGGGLIFIAATMDNLIRALDIDTGQELWSAKLPAPGMAVPMTYEAGGRQYVVIAAGGSTLIGTALSDHLIAYALRE